MDANVLLSYTFRKWPNWRHIAWGRKNNINDRKFKASWIAPELMQANCINNNAAKICKKWIARNSFLKSKNNLRPNIQYYQKKVNWYMQENPNKFWVNYPSSRFRLTGSKLNKYSKMSIYQYKGKIVSFLMMILTSIQIMSQGMVPKSRRRRIKLLNKLLTLGWKLRNKWLRN